MAVASPIFLVFTPVSFVSYTVSEKHTASIFRVTELVQVDAVQIQLSCNWMQYVPVKDRGKQMQYVPVKDTGQTKHTTLRKNPK
jgi:hypothetical protein